MRTHNSTCLVWLVFAGLALCLVDAQRNAPPPPPTDPCAVNFTFFPKGREDANRPEGWSASTQMALNGNLEDKLVMIVTSGYPHPLLHVAPKSVLSTLGAVVPEQCVGAASTGRRLAQAATGRKVIRPAAYTVTYTLNQEAPVRLPGQFGGSSTNIANISLIDLQRRPDGDYCLTITITVLQGTAQVASTVGVDDVMLPTQDQTVTREACFIKKGTRPTAIPTFHSCGLNFDVALANLTPLPREVSVPGSKTGIILYSPRFTVSGKLNRSFTGEVFPDGTIDYFTQMADVDYFTMNVTADNSTSLNVSVPNAQFVDGWYDITVEGGLITQYPGMVSLPGGDQYFDGVPKYMGLAMNNGTPFKVAVQNKPSALREITMEPPTAKVGDVIMFTWSTDGYGRTECFLDEVGVNATLNVPTPGAIPLLTNASALNGTRGVVLPASGGLNATDDLDDMEVPMDIPLQAGRLNVTSMAQPNASSTCRSPFQYTLRDSKNHSLRIVMTDVCGNKIIKLVHFNGSGFYLDPKYEPVEETLPELTANNGTPPAAVRRPRTVNSGSTSAPASSFVLLLTTAILYMVW